VENLPGALRFGLAPIFEFAPKSVRLARPDLLGPRTGCCKLRGFSASRSGVALACARGPHRLDREAAGIGGDTARAFSNVGAWFQSDARFSCSIAHRCLSVGEFSPGHRSGEVSADIVVRLVRGA
jgi:hypothetical protein